MLRLTTLVLLATSLLVGCVTSRDPMTGGQPIDQIPMYGGMNRQEIPELKIADQRFISDVSEGFNGDLKKAASYWIDIGFEYYKKNDLANAMRRFNQAWLLDAENPEVYWGFSSVLSDKQDFCEARKMADIALSKGLSKNGFLADAAIIYTGCALTNLRLSGEEKNGYLKQSEELFLRAYQQDENKGYVLVHWARARYAQGDYAGAWEKVKEQRKAGGTAPTEMFLSNLKQKMSEPK
ncbi:MAG: tetratricopeptide repeat protein [Thermodesulfobacteriota bacterium]